MNKLREKELSKIDNFYNLYRQDYLNENGLKCLVCDMYNEILYLHRLINGEVLDDDIIAPNRADVLEAIEVMKGNLKYPEDLDC